MERTRVEWAPPLFRDEEVLYLPLAKSIGWVRTHGRITTGLPCTGEGCVLCAQGRKGRGRVWTGYLPCLVSGGTGTVYVVGLRPDTYGSCAQLSAPGLDLRSVGLAVRRPAGHRAGATTFEVLDGQDPEGTGLRQWPTTKECLLSLWKLPAKEPDYRMDVYFSLTLRTQPEDGAAPLNGLGVS